MAADLSHEDLLRQLMSSVLYSGLSDSQASELLALKEEALRRMRAGDKGVEMKVVRHVTQVYTDQQWLDVLAAPYNATCNNCEHRKTDHYSAQPTCMEPNCPCPGFLVG